MPRSTVVDIPQEEQARRGRATARTLRLLVGPPHLAACVPCTQSTEIAAVPPSRSSVYRNGTVIGRLPGLGVRCPKPTGPACAHDRAAPHVRRSLLALLEAARRASPPVPDAVRHQPWTPTGCLEQGEQRAPQRGEQHGRAHRQGQSALGIVLQAQGHLPIGSYRAVHAGARAKEDCGNLRPTASHGTQTTRCGGPTSSRSVRAVAWPASRLAPPAECRRRYSGA